MLAVFATLRAAPGRRDELVAALEAGFPAVEAEEGTLVYALHTDATDADLVHYYELYASREAFDLHAAGAGEALADLAPLLGGRPELTFAHPVRAKGLAPS